MDTQLGERDLLGMVVVLGGVNEVEGLDAGAELGGQRVDVGENLGLGPGGRCGFDCFGSGLVGHVCGVEVAASTVGRSGGRSVR